VRCIFCQSDIDDTATVCPACNRDLVVPPALLKERDELVEKRDLLMAELADAKAMLESRRRRRAHR
jgi:hypothetical protein